MPTLRLLLLSVAWLSATLGASELPDWKQDLLPFDDSWQQVEQHFVFNNDTEVKSLDPALMTDVSSGRVAVGLFEGLVGLHPISLRPVPGVATDWAVSDDGRRWTFHLRETSWSDGRPLTAADFIWSWRRVLTPATGSEYAYQLFPVRGAEAYFNDPESGFDAVGLAAPDPQTLIVELQAPCPYFLDLVAFHTLYPTPRHLIEAAGDGWTKPGVLVGNGPFVLTERKPKQFIRMEPNPRYWDAAFVKLKAITVRPYESAETGVKLFQQGELHWQPSVPASMVDDLKHDPDYYVTPYLGTYYYRFNVERRPFDDVRVRRALSLAIDRQVITEHILKAGQQPTSTFCPPGCGGYEPIAGLGFDRQAARALWAETPYGQGEPLPAIEILYNTSESHKAVAENIAEQWQANLGIDVQLRNLEWKVYLDRMTNLDYSVMRSAWIGDYNDPNTFFDCFVTGSGNNRTGWSDPGYDDLIAQAAATQDQDARLQIFRQAEELLVTEGCPIAPIYFYVNQGLLSEQVGGWFDNIRDQHPLQYIYLAP